MSGNLLLVLIVLGGYLSGRLADRLRLPSVLGMTLFGLLLGYFAGHELPAGFDSLAPYLKSLALVIILLRAGLGLHAQALRKAGRTALLLAVLPSLFEGTVVTLLFRYRAQLPWLPAMAAGALMAAISPAVVIPSMLSLRDMGYGSKRQVPTAVLAGATLDNVVVITLFTIILALARGGDLSIGASLLSIPYSVIGGIVPGLLAGFLMAWWFKRHSGTARSTEHGLMLIGTAFLLLEAGNIFHTTALLGVIAAGFILLYRAEKQAHELSAMLRQAWVGAEIVLFVLIGLSVDLLRVLDAGLFSLGIVAAGLLFRSLGVLLATGRSGFTWNERLFCLISFIPKATVQAALGALPLAYGIEGGELILSTSVTAILFTAPAGLLLLKAFGERLLSDTA
jgi:solute carrier family 9B (sodium/hydrogen exchanger), member 1/2